MIERETLTKNEWERLVAVTFEEKRKALKQLARWVTWQITRNGFNMEYGPFSYAAMGGNAVEVIAEECYEALMCGEWHWKENRTLSSMLIQIAKSKMGHIIREYYDRDSPEMTLTSEQSFREQAEMDLACQWEREANIRDMGYEIAREVVKSYPMLMAYLDALYRYNDYYGIASVMGITVKKVMELEKQLLDLLKKR